MKSNVRTVLCGGSAMFALLTGASATAQTATAQAATTPAPAAQDAPAAPEAAPAPADIVVVGSQIRGARTTAALPVTVLDAKDIAASGAVSGDDLFRSIPQMGDVSFNQANTPATSNAARGDVNSINLRSLGVGNTLVLLNGRRLVQHPTSQAGETGVPVLGYNSNSIPVAGVQRLEVLRDGAAAIYGADAVAGVVNTVLQDNFHGLDVDLQYGGAEGTHLRDFDANVFAGHNFAEGRGNISVFVNYDRRTAQRASDEDYTANANLVPLFAGDPAFAGNLTADRRTIQTPWGNFSTPAANGVIRQGAVALTTAAGAFHVQPTTLAGCATPTSGTNCIGVGTNAFTGALRDLRYDVLNGTTLSPSLNRINIFLQGHYDVSDGVTLFGEAGFYQGKTHQVQAPVLNLSAIAVPASNYYNPFGPVTFANGQANPNRLPGLTNVPVAGLPVTMTNSRFVDAGLQQIDVTNRQYRGLLGLRGDNLFGFHWEAAALYSWATALDSSDAIDSTRLQQQLALSTPDAYNPFNGGCATSLSVNDCTPSSQAAIDAIKFKLLRRDETTLALGDFKISRGDLLKLPGGNLGIALGLEGRRETQFDDRDPNIDGTIVFRDAVTGATNLSNVTAVSPNPDTRGARTVFSAYAELAVPVISEDMNIPLVRQVELQIAGRYEHYSDFGSIAKPKIAGYWDVVKGIRLRGSYSKGFRAPNLEQVNATQYARAGSNTDYLRCEADLRAGRIAAFSGCGRSSSFQVQTSGNPNLRPENSDNYSAGIVLQPNIADGRFGRFTFTTDWWRIKEVGVVGQIGAQNALVIDYLLRLQGSSNPNVVRAAPTADDTALFAGTGIAAAGTVLTIADQFRNLLPQDVRGVDFGATWALRGTDIGDFDVNINAAYLYKFQRDVSPDVAQLFAARAAGTINPATPLTDASNVLRQNGKPKWKWSGSLTWTYKPVQIGLFTQYIGSVVDSGFLDATGTPHLIDSRLTANLYVQFTVPHGGALGGTRFRLGARNITDEQPPLSSGGANSGAYLGTLYNPYGRYWYFSIGRKF
jgi:outer membrane receptor protein involved in Fe transport